MTTKTKQFSNVYHLRGPSRICFKDSCISQRLNGWWGRNLVCEQWVWLSATMSLLLSSTTTTIALDFPRGHHQNKKKWTIVVKKGVGTAMSFSPLGILLDKEGPFLSSKKRRKKKKSCLFQGDTPTNLSLYKIRTHPEHTHFGSDKMPVREDQPLECQHSWSVGENETLPVTGF